MDIALPVAAVRFFDGVHAVVGAHAVPHETLKPVERIDDNRAVVVLLVAHRLKLENDVVEALRQRELRAVDLRKPVLRLDEHGVRNQRGERALPDALRAVDHDAGRPRLAAFRD